MEEQHIYIAIDLKSFYASVECVERKLDPLTTHLVVADASRTEKTICLAVSPSLKAYGIPGRARLFEVVQRIRQVNRERVRKAPGQKFTGTSHLIEELNQHPELGVDYIVAPPRMAFYMDYSTRIYDVYLRYVAPERLKEKCVVTTVRRLWHALIANRQAWMKKQPKILRRDLQ